MEIYLKFKKQLLTKDDEEVAILIANHKAEFTNALYYFEHNLQEVNKQEIDFKLSFYVGSTVIFGLYKSKVKNGYFEKIFVDKKLQDKLIELDTIINVVDSLNQNTNFYFKKDAILKFFYNYSLCYMLNEIFLKASYKKKEFDEFHNEFNRFVRKKL